MVEVQTCTFEKQYNAITILPPPISCFHPKTKSWSWMHQWSKKEVVSVCCGDHDDSGSLAMVMGMSFHGLLEALKACNDDGVVKLPMPPLYTLNHEHL